MPRKKKRFGSCCFKCWKRTSSSTTLVGDIDDVSQLSRQTDGSLPTTCTTDTSIQTTACQACRQVEKKAIRRNILKFWRKSGSQDFSEDQTRQRTKVNLIDIIPENGVQSAIPLGIVFGNNVDESVSENRDAETAINTEQRVSNGRWIKPIPDPPQNTGSYVAIDVKEFIQKINSSQPEDPVEAVKAKKRAAKARTLSSGHMPLEVHEAVHEKIPEKSVHSATLSQSSDDEVVPVVAEASQTITEKIFYMDESPKVIRNTTAQENEELASESNTEGENNEKWLFTVLDHQMDRKPVRSPMGAVKTERIVTKVLKDITARHAPGISETEVRFKKKKTPIVRQVSQAVQTIVSNASIIEDNSHSKVSTRNKYKNEFALKPSETQPLRSQYSLKDKIAFISESDKCEKNEDRDKLPMHKDKSDAMDYKAESKIGKGDTVKRNGKQLTGVQVDKQIIDVSAAVQQKLTTNVVCTKEETKTDKLKQSDSLYSNEKTKFDNKSIKPRRRAIVKDRISDERQEGHREEVLKDGQEISSDFNLMAHDQTVSKMSETALAMLHKVKTGQNLRTKEPLKEQRNKKKTSSGEESHSDKDMLKPRANLRYPDTKLSTKPNDRTENTVIEKKMNKNENIVTDSKTKRQEINYDTMSLKVEKHLNKKKNDDIPEQTGMKYTFTSRSDLYMDRDKLVRYKHISKPDATDKSATAKPQMAKSDTDKPLQVVDINLNLPAKEERINTRFGYVFRPMQPAMATWYHSYVGENGNLFSNAETESEAVRPGTGLLRASARFFDKSLTGKKRNVAVVENTDSETDQKAGSLKGTRENKNKEEENTSNKRRKEESPDDSIDNDSIDNAVAACSIGSTDEEKLMSLGFSKAQAAQALEVNEKDVCRAAEWLFSGSDIDSKDSPRTKTDTARAKKKAREAHASLSRHAPIDFIPKDIQEFYNKKRISPTSKDEYERGLALAMLEVEPVPLVASGSYNMGERGVEQVNSVGAFFSSPHIKHGKQRTDGDGAEDTTSDDRTETSATSGSRTEDESWSRPGSRPIDVDSKTLAEVDLKDADTAGDQEADQSQGCHIM